ncbi:unnamed protein product [Mesocestoides corti]|uniref:CBS domain-containing protein n=1 Tax=Mesocestoides corti TaxID=53468 RepID=A0A3P6GLH7_MESCO|nr:unnamed protein product [Mesocestoides corti]
MSNSSDSKSHHVGRFVVLKATVSNVNEESVSRSLNNDVKLNSESNATTYSHDNHYWTVSGGRGVLLTAPGARRADDSRPTSSGPGKSVHTRFRQFFVENLRNSRLRTHSEQQHSGTSRNAFLSSDSPNKLKPPVATYGAGLPPHAHTITAGTGSAVAKALLQSTQRSKDDGAIGSGSPETSGISSSPIHGHYPSVSVSSVNDSEASIKPPKRKLKSTHKMVRRLLKLSSGQKKHEFYTGDLPDPSKLPREFPQSSLEFTQSRLKNVPRRSTPTHNYGRKGKSAVTCIGKTTTGRCGSFCMEGMIRHSGHRYHTRYRKCDSGVTVVAGFSTMHGKSTQPARAPGAILHECLKNSIPSMPSRMPKNFPEDASPVTTSATKRQKTFRRQMFLPLELKHFPGGYLGSIVLVVLALCCEHVNSQTCPWDDRVGRHVCPKGWNLFCKVFLSNLRQRDRFISLYLIDAANYEFCFSVISVGHHPIIPSALATQGEAKSEELLLSAFSRSLSGSSGHRGSHHSHHHHHGNGHHHHHKHHSYYRGHYGHVRRTSSRLHHPTTLTRVTENSRYLMFTKASPFRSPFDFLQTRGKGLSRSIIGSVQKSYQLIRTKQLSYFIGESEIYTVLFRHTTCYELMPESAKLVTLDSMLPVSSHGIVTCHSAKVSRAILREAPAADAHPIGQATLNAAGHFWRSLVSHETCRNHALRHWPFPPCHALTTFGFLTVVWVGKAFRALCLNGIRAAPVWDSETQSFSGILTINDFLEMLTYCWRHLSSDSATDKNSPKSDLLTVEDLESISIRRWKEICGRTKASEERKSVTFSSTISDLDNTAAGEEEEECAGSVQDTHCSGSSVSESSSDDVDGTNSIASAPSQLGDSSRNWPRCPCHGDGGSRCSVRLKYHRMGGLTVIYPDDSLYTALRLLAHTRLHRLPVFDDPVCGTGNPLFVLTHRSLLAYLYRKQIDLPRPKYLQSSLKEAGVGTYDNLALVMPSTKLVDALAFFEDERVSVLPVVDSLTNRRLVDIFAKFDVITLILAGKYKNPDMTVQDVLDNCKQIHRGVIPMPEGQNKFDVEICLTTDTIQYALNKLMRTGYHRLIVVDSPVNCRTEGVVSISDLLYYMVLRLSPRGPVAASNADPMQQQQHQQEEEQEAPEWLFYSEKDEHSMCHMPSVPLVTPVKELPEVNTLTHLAVANGDGVDEPRRHKPKRGSRRRRVTSGSSVATTTSSSSVSSSASASSSASTSASSTDYSSSSEDGSTTPSSVSRSRSGSSRSPKTKAKSVMDRRGGKTRLKTIRP